MRIIRKPAQSPKPALSLRLLLIYLSVLLSAGICYFSGLIPAWGKWYSPSLPHRLETNAFFHGRFSISDSPADTALDLVWINGGVQQNWGLAVPCWRFVFEILARLVGEPAFPDRLSLAIALALLGYIYLRTFSVNDGITDVHSWLKQLPEKILPALVILCFPPILTFFRVPFFVYEETSSYGYLFGVGLFAGVISFLCRPTFLRYCIINGLAGLSGFVRPTIMAYGMATVIVMFLLSRSVKWPLWKSLLGPGLWTSGCSLLLFTNQVRFGSLTNFGQGLALSPWYELRFETPYNHEPLYSAARELAGMLFATEQLNDLKFYQSEFIPGQSDTPRCRCFYSLTFDSTYLMMILLSWWFAVRFRRVRGKSGPMGAMLSIHRVAAAWSFLAAIPLTVFYLRYIAMSSRYVLDFAPAIGVAISGLLWLILSVQPRFSKWIIVLFCNVLICAWWIWEMEKCITPVPPPPVLTWEELEPHLVQRASAVQLPDKYVATDPDSYGIPWNRVGWWNKSGDTSPLVILFVSDPQEISLEIACEPGTNMSEQQHADVQVKVGTEPLKLESEKSRGDTRILTFSRPERPLYQRGIQVVFVGLVPPEEFTVPKSKYRLLSVTWKGQETASFAPDASPNR